MRVLALGAGGAATNGFVRALRMAGGYELVGANANPDDLLLSECETNHLIARADDYTAWKRDIWQLLFKSKFDFIHAQSDVEVEALGKARVLFHTMGAKTFLPRQSVIELCRDKHASFLRWRAADLPLPSTRLVEGREALLFIQELTGGPMWLRPRIGQGGQKSRLAPSFKEAVDWINEHDGWGEFTAAEVLTSQSVTVQQIYWHGELVVSQQRRRDGWANAASTTTGVSGSTGIGVTASDVRADEVADAAVAAIDDRPHGIYGVDMTLNEAGMPCPTEINIGRFFTTSSEFFARAGRDEFPDGSHISNFPNVYVSIGCVPRHSSDSTDHPPHWGPNVRNPIPDGKRWIRGMDRPPVLVG